MDETYTPTPVDTSDVTLPVGLLELRETLAAHIHDTWSVGKISKGYTYGPVTSDEKKTHKDLVRYHELTEDSKSYDRNTSEQSLKLIYKLGYKIVKV